MLYSFSMKRFWQNRRWVYGLAGGALLILIIVTTIWFFPSKSVSQKQSAPPEDVVLPTIYEGQLYLPKTVAVSDESNFNKGALGRLMINSLNLAALTDKDGKFVGIRVLGEVTNTGNAHVVKVSPVARFYDDQGKLVGQKIAQMSAGFDFPELGASQRSVYDISISNPPVAEKLEIIFNVAQSSFSAQFAPLKITNRQLEEKTTSFNNTRSLAATDSSQAAEVPSSLEEITYYIVSGQVVNSLENPVTDITVYAWGKNEENRVFTIGRVDFKNDLLKPGEKIDFKVLLAPIKANQTLINYEIAAWGREYKFNF